jgi:hypothetical protein
MWLRAYFAAGGDFRHVESIKKLIMELKPGVEHRVKDRYVENVFPGHPGSPTAARHYLDRGIVDDYYWVVQQIDGARVGPLSSAMRTTTCRPNSCTHSVHSNRLRRSRSTTHVPHPALCHARWGRRK